MSSAASSTFPNSYSLRLAADASVGGAFRIDVRGGTFDMGGNTLTSNNAEQFTLNSSSVLNPGKIDIKTGAIAIETTTALNGGATNTLTLENNTKWSDYDSSVTQKWGLLTTGNVTLINANNNANNVNLWSGTAVLGGNFSINTGNAAAAITFGGNISGTGSIQVGVGATVANLGTFTLSGANTYSGTTLVSSGVLRMGGTNALGGTNTVTVASGATLDVSTFQMMNQPNKFIIISGTGAAGQAGALVSSGVGELNGAFTGSYSLRLAANATVGGTNRVDVRGSSTNLTATFDMQNHNLITNFTGTSPNNQFTLSNVNVLNPGNIDVKAGQISLEVNTQLNGTGTNTLTLENNATIQDWDATVAQNWGLITVGNAVWINNDNNTGNFNLWNGTVQLGGNLAINPGNANGNAAITIGGNISGPGSVQITGPGRLTLSGTNTYSGTTGGKQRHPDRRLSVRAARFQHPGQHHRRQRRGPEPERRHFHARRDRQCRRQRHVPERLFPRALTPLRGT